MIADRYVPQPRHRQHGVALIMAMVFLMILTIIGVTVMSTTSLQEKMAGNVQDKHSAFQAAESALRAAESLVETWAAKPTDFVNNTNGYYMPQPGSELPWWESIDWTPNAGAARTSAATLDVRHARSHGAATPLRTRPSMLVSSRCHIARSESFISRLSATADRAPWTECPRVGSGR